MPRFEHTSTLSTSPEALWDWHMRPGAFERLVPPWEHIRVVQRPDALVDGARLSFRMRVFPGLWHGWTAVHEGVARPAGFTDVQERGPFAAWRHQHRFDPAPGGARLVDTIDWATPLGTSTVARYFVEQRLRRTFAFRHRRTEADLRRHQAHAHTPPLHVVVSGASGLVGTALTAFLSGGGHRVSTLVRREPRGPDEIRWSVRDGTIDEAALEGVSAVVHLAGAGIADRRWSAARKDLILSSRVDGTRLLSRALANLDRKPAVLISGSAVGFYGDTGDRRCREDAPPGDNFLASVCQAWEREADIAADAGIRVVKLRTGYVMSARGGALAAQLPLFRMGGGGPVGSGSQYIPFVGIDDLVGIIHHALHDDRLEGPVNATAPEPVTQRVFARTLGRVLRRPAVVPAPAFAIRAALGEMGQQLVLEGQRAIPGKLLEQGFSWEHPDLEDLLRFELGR